MKKLSMLISAFMTLAVGILFLILKTDVISIAITVISLALFLKAALDVIRLRILSGVVKVVLGIAVLIVGWWLIDVAVLILGAVLLAFGALRFLKALFRRKRGVRLWKIIITLIEPVICVMGALLLINSRGVALEGVVTVVGIILVVDGVLALLGTLGSSNK